MTKIRTATDYNISWLQTDKPQPLMDKKINDLIIDIQNCNLSIDISDSVYEDFKNEMEEYLISSKLNNLKQLKNWNKKDICLGCTQFIDTIYMSSFPQIIKGDYKYHQRLNSNIIYSKPKNLISGKPLIIAMPFPSTGNKHTDMEDILNECLEKNIPVHIDGAWVTCCKDIDFDFDHPAIKSIAISLSKGLGLGWNRIGLRWTKQRQNDAITIMNDHNMNLRAVANIGLHFLRNVPIDHLWLTHADNYYKVCKDFNLTPTKSIYLALKDNQPVGLSPLLRYLENDN